MSGDSSSDDLVTKFVLCGSLGRISSVVGTQRAYEKTPIQPDKPLGKLFLVPSNPTHSKALLFSGLPTDIVSTQLLSIEQLDHDNFLITIPPTHSLSPFTVTAGNKHSQAQNSPSEGKSSSLKGQNIPAVTQLYFRCPECKNRSLNTIPKLTSTNECTTCKKELNIYHWTGRLGPLNTTPIPDITAEFTRKYLVTNGFIQRKINLWVRETNGTMCYIDFRGKKIPTFYAFDDDGAVDRKRLPVVLVQSRRELIPYLDRPRASEISGRRSRQSNITTASQASDPLELQSIIDELTSKGIDVLEFLKNYDERFNHPLLVYKVDTKELNIEHHIIKAKCPECGSQNFSIVENSMGKAERCMDCKYLKLLGEDDIAKDNGRGSSTGNSDNEKQPPSADESFF